VNDIGGRLGLRQAQVSQHLKVLKDVGLVEVEPSAQRRLYKLRAQPLKQLHKWLDRYRFIWEERFEQLDEIVEELKRKKKSDAAGKSRWVPKSLGVSLFECESDLRVGGTYRYAFGRDSKKPEVFSGRYIEVNPPLRVVLTGL
jgi:DNA-binding transcriptional ArsR family regulator